MSQLGLFRVLFACLALAVPLQALAAQFSASPPPAAYALRGVTVITPDAGERTDMTVVVRGGMIEALGSDTTVPPDALLLEGDSLHVYPGFVDAHGSAAFTFPEPEVDRNDVASWAPPRSLQSFTPHRRVVDHLTATGEDVAPQRKNGVIAAAVHPDGRLMPGQGTLLLLRRSADTPTGLVVAPTVGVTMSFRGAQGVYPQQHFAVLAFMRQTFEDARRGGEIVAEYQRDPNGMTAPLWDPDHAVLRESLRGETPVFFAADDAEDIRQVLELATAYGLRPYIVGGHQAWKVADVLRERGVPVLVSLDFPKPTRWDPKKDTLETALDPAVRREKTEIERTFANAGRLAAAGVTIALTSGGGKAQLLDGARTAIEHGLDTAQALRALTVTPAQLLGVPHFAQVAPGRPANFVVTNGPMFGENSKIVYTFVEGELERGTATSASSETADGETPADIAGTWQMESSIMGDTRRSRATIVQSGTTFQGSTTIEEGTLRIEDGVIRGNTISFVVNFEFGDQVLVINYSGTVEGDQITGEMTMEFGSGTWRATRIRTPGEGA